MFKNKSNYNRFYLIKKGHYKLKFEKFFHNFHSSSCEMLKSEIRSNKEFALSYITKIFLILRDFDPFLHEYFFIQF